MKLGLRLGRKSFREQRILIKTIHPPILGFNNQTGTIIGFAGNQTKVQPDTAPERIIFLNPKEIVYLL